MTRRRIEAIVKTWQARLRLDHWEIKVDWSKSAHDEAYATTYRLNSYDRATMHFDPGFLTWTEGFANQTVVHELLHLITRDLDRVLGDAETSLLPETYRMMDRRYDHEIEGVVDRLATIIVDMA